MTGVQTCALPISPLFILPQFSLRQRPAFFSDHFSLRQRPRFLSCPFLFAAAPHFFTALFSLRQRPLFLYCPFLVAAAPHFLYCPGSRCGSATLFLLTISRCGSAPHFLPISRCGSARAFYTYQFSLRQRRSEEHTSELQSPVPISYAVFCLTKKKTITKKSPADILITSQHHFPLLSPFI